MDGVANRVSACAAELRLQPLPSKRHRPDRQSAGARETIAKEPLFGLSPDWISRAAFEEHDELLEVVMKTMSAADANRLPAIRDVSWERRFQFAREVDKRGKAIVLTTTLEHAELKRDQIHAFGADRLMARCKGSMSATIESQR